MTYSTMYYYILHTPNTEKLTKLDSLQNTTCIPSKLNIRCPVCIYCPCFLFLQWSHRPPCCIFRLLKTTAFQFVVAHRINSFVFLLSPRCYSQDTSTNVLHLSSSVFMRQSAPLMQARMPPGRLLLASWERRKEI